MIRWPLVRALFAKELKETLRDRRTLLLAIGLPVVLYPLIAMGITKLQTSRAEAQEAARSKVAVWGIATPTLQIELSQTNRYEVLPWLGMSEATRALFGNGSLPSLPETTTTNGNAAAKAHGVPASGERGTGPADKPDHVLIEEARALLSTRTADAVLLLWPDFEKSLTTGGVARADVLYDSVRESSQKAEDRLSESLSAIRREEIQSREARYRLPSGFSQAVKIQSRNVAPAKRQIGSVLGSFLPFLLMVLSASGGLYAAIDLTAGEKERNTLQTLLCAPLTSLEIIVGKFFAAWMIVLLTTLANLASMGATFSRIASSYPAALSTAASSYVLAFLVLLPATFMMTALFLSVAVFARDFKDGQNLLTPMFMVLTLPLGATMLPDMELNAWTSFVPLVNIALLIKGVFLREAKPELVFFALLSSILYAGLALSFAARVFQQEQVLLGGKQSWKGLFQWSSGRRPVPTAPFALGAFVAVFVVVFYASRLLEGVSTPVMILGTQLGFFLLPNLLMAWRWGFSWTETYQFRKPSMLSITGAILVGLSAWGVTAGLVTRVFPPPESVTQALEKVLMFEGFDFPIWVVWLLLGVTPAVCEELFFRGLILAGFRNMGRWTSLILSSLLFAVAHASIYRLLPTFALGMLIGYATWTSRSMWVGITIHAVNNSLLVTFLHWPELAKKLGFNDMAFVPWSWALGALAVTLCGMGLIRNEKRIRPL